MQENCFYFIKDEFFEKFKEEKLLLNHMNNKNRPCFYALKNNNEDIYWLIPISSKVKKYKEIYNIKMNKFKKCDTIVFGNVLGYEKAFLIQNIFPITNKYILNKYFDKNNNEVKIEKYLEKDIKQKSKKIIAIQRKGINITFANIIKMEKVLIDELKTTNMEKIMNYIIENKNLKVQINKLGGSLSSIFDKENNKELLYQKEPNSWQGQDIAIFPFVARLKDKTYIYEGKVYSLRNHGLCRYYEFDEYLKTNDSITLLFKYNEDTLKEYPFKFEFYIEYKLINNTLYITYKVVNIDSKEMIFGIGAHPAFIINSKIIDGKLNTDDNYVQFDSKKDLTRIMFDEKGEFVIGEEKFGSVDRIYTKKEYFVKYKTLCLKGKNINDVTLVRADNIRLKFHYNNINYFVMWSMEETGSYVALEPWMSLPDYSDCSKDLKDKKTLIHLPSNNEYIFAYLITIDK